MTNVLEIESKPKQILTVDEKYNLKAGCNALLDNLKTDSKLLEARTEYYTLMIKTMLELLDINQTHCTKLSFVQGSSFQLYPKYTMDVYKLNALLGLSDAKVVKQKVYKL